jgi:uncharacterized membrane-anchored protein YitT (DUF2179 family)
MSPCNEVYQAVPFDGATSDAEEALIAAGGDAEEEEDQQGRLEERTFARLLLASLLFGLLMGIFFMVTADLLGANCLAVYFEMKSNTDFIVFSLLWNLFTLVAPLVLILVSIRNWGHSEALREDMITQLECHFGVGVYAGIYLAYILMDDLLGNPAHVVEYTFVSMVVAFIWYKVMMASSATDTSKPSSTRSVSTAEQTTQTV